MSLAVAQQTLARVQGIIQRDSILNDSGGSWSFENPRTSWDRIFEVPETYTGRGVTQYSALQSMAVWACVRVISNNVAMVPFETLTVDGTNLERTPSHYCWRLFQNYANPYQTGFRFRRMMQAWLLLWGNAYAEIELNGRGQVVNLWPWRPDRVQVWSESLGNPPEIPSGSQRDDGTGIFYTYTRNNGQMVTLPSHYVLHLRGLELDGYLGLSPIACGRQSISLDQASLEYGARFFGNNGRPGGFLSMPTKLSPDGRKNLRESFEDLHRGLRGAHRIGLLEEGMKYTDVGVPPEDMQFLQTRQFQAIDIARLFGVPPHKIAELARATFSNIEHQSIEFVSDCLKPWFRAWESEGEVQLLADRELGTTILRHDPSQLLVGDAKSQMEALSSGVTGGIYSPNEARGKLGMNAYDGGDTFRQQMQMVPSGGETDPATDPDGLQDSVDDQPPPGKSKVKPTPPPAAGTDPNEGA